MFKVFFMFPFNLKGCFSSEGVYSDESTNTRWVLAHLQSHLFVIMFVSS